MYKYLIWGEKLGSTKIVVAIMIFLITISLTFIGCKKLGNNSDNINSIDKIELKNYIQNVELDAINNVESIAKISIQPYIQKNSGSDYIRKIEYFSFETNVKEPPVVKSPAAELPVIKPPTKEHPWEHVDSNENMFAHNALSQDYNNRLITIEDGYLTDSSDLVEKSSSIEEIDYINILEIAPPGITDQQMNFIINTRYFGVLTRQPHTEVNKLTNGTYKILYRSIHQVWPDYPDWDWEHVDSNENMFAHNTLSKDYNNRLTTIWNGYLMNPGDLVEKGSPDELDHWINYYAITASQQVYDNGYDGVFIDSAEHRLWIGGIKSKLIPDGYSRATRIQQMYDGLEFIKSYFPDKMVLFNGLHSDSSAEDSLAVTDGGIWEPFGFREATGEYHGKSKWLEVIELTERNKQGKFVILTPETPNLINDIPVRMFLFSSYLLVSNKNVAFSMSDRGFSHYEYPYYFPEYDVDLGQPLGSYTDNNGIYKREFKRGLVLVNPSENLTLKYKLDGGYSKVVPVGGGLISKNGNFDGSLTYKEVGQEVMLSPIKGIILKRNPVIQDLRIILTPTDLN